MSARDPLHASSVSDLAAGNDLAVAWPLNLQASVIVTGILVAVLVVVGAGLWWQRSRRRSAERAVEEREATLRASYERTRRLAGRLIDVQESTRAAIARDLHDEVCQELVAIALGLTSLKTSHNASDAEFQAALRRLHQRMLSTVEGVRRLSHDLHPASLRLLGLPAALRAHCVEVEKQYDVQVNLTAGTDIGRIPQDMSLCLFRIAQEALRNGAVHGEARHMGVSLVRVGDEIELTVSDDGCGFDADAARRDGGGLGLVSMEERVHLAGGRFEVLSRPQIGTSVRARVRVAPERVIDKPVLVRRSAGGH